MNNRLTERQQAFLDAYRYSGMVKEAAETIGCSRELHYGAMRTSEAYREAFAQVQCDVAVELEEEARRRAVDGVKVPIVFRGKVVGYDTRHSDALLIFLLEANHPEKFAGIKEELGRNKDFGVRWDRDEIGRPTLSRMTGPTPPMPPRPPRPPQPPAGFWHQAGDCGEAIATPSEAGVVARTPPDADVIARWGPAPSLSRSPPCGVRQRRERRMRLLRSMTREAATATTVSVSGRPRTRPKSHLSRRETNGLSRPTVQTRTVDRMMHRTETRQFHDGLCRVA